MWGRTVFGKGRSAGRSNFQSVIDFQVPGWHKISIAVFVFSVGEKGWDLSWERGKIAVPPTGSCSGAPFVFLHLLFFISGSRVGLPAEQGLLSPPEFSPPGTPSPTSSPPFPCGLRPSWTRDQCSLTQEQEWTPPNKDLFIWPLESGQGGTGNNWNRI